MRSLLILLIIGIGISCENPEPEKNPKLIEDALQSRLERFMTKKRKSCKERLMTDVHSMVDSIIAEQLNLDTIDFPARPIKPSNPGLKEVPTDLELSPIKK